VTAAASTTSDNDRCKMLAEETEPHTPQRVGALKHHLSISRPECVPVWKVSGKLHDVFEVNSSANELPLAMGEASHAGATSALQRDNEKPKATHAPSSGHGEGPAAAPEANAAIARRFRQHIDDAAEQNRLGKLRNRKCKIAEGESPAEPGFLPSSSRTRM